MRSFFLFFSFFLAFSLAAQEFQTPFEKSNQSKTATYSECREWYVNIQKSFPEITFFDSIGVSDGGFPIYTFRLYTGENPKPVKMLIMNNIHPGEPEGTDASMLLVRNLLTDKKSWTEVRRNIDLSVICQYNVDGTLNRSCCSRANQNGPEELGFRGNAKNLDLNRDFIKCDSRNAQAFARFFSQNEFHFFIDNHTSNGADYQYTLTWFHTREQKLHPDLSPLLLSISNDLSHCLNKCNIPTSPYVNTMHEIPDSGIVAFWESPRFSTGYAALFHCMGFTVETHMFKPFPDRVQVTLAFMENLLRQVSTDERAAEIEKIYRGIFHQPRLTGNRTEVIQWELDKTRWDEIEFRGYEAKKKTSEISGLQRLYYDRNAPWIRNIKYYKYFVPTDSVFLPRMYLLPQAWTEVVQRLQWNNIKLRMLSKDTVMQVRCSYIKNYETSKRPYESHYLHYNVSTFDTLVNIQFYAGDYYVIVDNSNRKYLAATLEPRSPDSYFNWNYFDGILMQKEWFSDYIFEEKAIEILKSNPNLKREFENEKANHPEFAKNHGEQLAWIYFHSEYYEKSHNRYPVYRFD